MSHSNQLEIHMSFFFFSCLGSKSQSSGVELRKVATNLEHIVRVGVVNVEKSPELKERFGIEKLPAVVIFNSEQQTKYPGEWKQMEIEKFAISKVPSYVTGLMQQRTTIYYIIFVYIIFVTKKKKRCSVTHFVSILRW